VSFSTPELSLTETLEAAREYGYDGIEPRLDVEHAHGIEVSATPQQRSEMKRQAADAGIEIAGLDTSITCVESGKADDLARQARERIDLAGDIGAHVLRVSDGVTRKQAVEIVADALRSVADHAASRDVVVCIETHGDWCDPAHVAAVMKQTRHPSIGVIWDVMHTVRAGDATMERAFRALVRWIRHVHVHDGTTGTGLPFLPIGEGAFDHQAVIDRLVTFQFDGFVSGEWSGWEPYEEHLPRELTTLKRYEEEAAQ
jgi:sugar phosphate isomerase/epimerase